MECVCQQGYELMFYNGMFYCSICNRKYILKDIIWTDRQDEVEEFISNIFHPAFSEKCKDSYNWKNVSVWVHDVDKMKELMGKESLRVKKEVLFNKEWMLEITSPYGMEYKVTPGFEIMFRQKMK